METFANIFVKAKKLGQVQVPCSKHPVIYINTLHKYIYLSSLEK